MAANRCRQCAQIAKDWGFNLIEIPIAPPGLEQQSQWLQIRQAKADWVTFWGAGAGMSGTAITTAARVGFPRNKIIFVTFGGAEEDMIAGGAQAKDTNVVAMVLPGKQWPLIADIEKTLYGSAGKGNMQNPSARRHDLLQPRRHRGGQLRRGAEERAEDPQQGRQAGQRCGIPRWLRGARLHERGEAQGTRH